MKAESIRIVIADDHKLIRDALHRLLETEPNLKVIGEAEDGAEAVKVTGQLKPDILLLDLAMPKMPGLDALRELSTMNNGSSTRVIILTAAAEKSEIVEALQLGARGIVMKVSATEVLLNALDAVMAGEFWVGLKPVSNLFQYLQTELKGSKSDAAVKPFGLTSRELQIVSGVVAALANKEIAQYFDIKENTVKRHLSNIFDKLGVSTRLELARFAVNRSLPLIDIGPVDGQP